MRDAPSTPPAAAPAPRTPRTPRRRLARALAALSLGALLALVLLEAGLWIAYGLNRPPERYRPVPAPRPSGRTILCIGDSNTYGVHLPAEESYPGQLQAFLDRWPESPWRVVNVGYPGLNTAQVRGRLADEIERHGAEIVIAWVGTNNTWSIAGRHLWGSPDREPDPGLFERGIQGARVLKLGRMLWNKFASRTHRTRVVTPDEVAERLAIDWRRIQAICAQRGVRLLTSDYPVHIEYTEQVVNRNLHAIARELGIPIVPLHREILPVAYGMGYDQTMFADYHAAARGNYAVARAFLRALIDAGWLEPREEWTSIPPLWETLDSFPLRVVSDDATGTTVLLHGPPGARYALTVLRLYTIKGDKTNNAAIPSPWFKSLSGEERAARGFEGRLDEDGRRRLVLALPAAPEQHPEPPDGQRPTWLGWRLRVQFETDAGPLELQAKLVRKDVLRDPAVLQAE